MAEQVGRGWTDVAEHLAEIARRFDGRGWVLGTSGNLSAVTSRDPLRLAITPARTAKGELTADRIVEVGSNGRVLCGGGRPSSEARLHIEIVRRRGAGAVLHTHSIWSTILSDVHASDGGVAIEGYEMLKGLEGVVSHEHSEWIPVLDNSQDMEWLAGQVGQTLERRPQAHGFLVRRHGLYTWGDDLVQATRHVEILEFLLEAVGTTQRLG